MCYGDNMSYTYREIEIRNRKGIEITGYSGSEKKLCIPAEIDGLPVISIGKEAFTDANKGLSEITLPDSVISIRAFAFYFCQDLHKLTLTDSVTDYYDGAIRTSSGVSEIDVTLDISHTELVHRIIEDSDRKMRVTFHFKDAEHSSLRLVFPEYNSNSIADPRAQTFHIRIEGSGFSYRECIRQDGLRIREYDSLFRKAVADNTDLSIDIAVARLQFPTWLSQTDADAYRAHLKLNILRTADLALLPENEDWTDVLIAERLLDETALDYMLKAAGERRLTLIVSRLMEYRHSMLQPAKKKTLSLDDWEF